ncbi:hypothetical protein Slin15195_G086710 [Septoria linicola]|uniref:DUF6536 domain-containing protein n=1 Tax=Septoria linicola TaxID=215465 RepID=A0A9Q9EMB2_9PEZI|nr:hypothetical protein Slin14017_G089300 [Septoria linicola]USW55352.1 hypothetical protein Slin15195_G086710 [Septoria linicola]
MELHDLSTRCSSSSLSDSQHHSSMLNIPSQVMDPIDGESTENLLQHHAEPKLHLAKYSRKRRLQGWRFGVTCAAASCSTILLVNIIIAIAARKSSARSGLICTIYEGPCSIVDRWSIGLHALINILGSLLFAASNYTMQCLASPTRIEIDKAHERAEWLEIGIPSFSNMSGRVCRRRVALWWMLAITSLPIHLVYNSVVFKTASASRYGVVVANESFTTGEPFVDDMKGWCADEFDPGSACILPEDRNYTKMGPWCADRDLSFDDCICANRTIEGTDNSICYNGIVQSCITPRKQAFTEGCFDEHYTYVSGFQSFGHETSPFKINNFTRQECFEAYNKSFLQDRGPLVLVTTATNHSFLSFEEFPGYLKSGGRRKWMCAIDADSCNGMTGQPVDAVYETAASYCLAAATSPRCNVQASLVLLTAVIVCNALKVLIMLLTLSVQGDETIVTVGDAIQSFLERPDEVTKDKILLDRHDLIATTLPSLGLSVRKCQAGRHPLSRRQRWSAAVTPDRWVTTVFLVTVAVGATSGALYCGARSLNNSFTGVSAWARGFGAMDTEATIQLKASGDGVEPGEDNFALIGTILLVNLPQVAATLVYFTYNNHLTCMLVAAEWSQYFLRKKPLRVSNPHGQQRSTYWLQLPFRYSIPLLLLSMLLHWLISTSFFLARINEVRFEPNGKYTTVGILSQAAYSCTPMLLAILLGIAMLAGLVVLGLRRLEGYMPIAGSCSLAIAAACHRPLSDVDAAYLPVSWGEIEGETKDDPPRYCFTSQDVSAPPWVPSTWQQKERSWRPLITREI